MKNKLNLTGLCQYLPTRAEWIQAFGVALFFLIAAVMILLTDSVGRWV